MNDIARLFGTNDIFAIAIGAIIALIVFVLILIVLYILYMLDAQRTMDALPPDNRPFPGATVWLALAPMIGFVWQFIFLISLSTAIQKEFARRRVREGSGFGLVIALVVMSCLSFVPSLFLSMGDIASLFGFVSLSLLLVPWLFIQLFQWRSMRRCRKTLLRTASWTNEPAGWTAQAPFPSHAAMAPSLPQAFPPDAIAASRAASPVVGDGWSLGAGVPSSSTPSARNPAVDQALAVAIEDQVLAVGRVSRDANRSVLVVAVVAGVLVAGVVVGVDALTGQRTGGAAARPTRVIVSTALANVRDSGSARGAVVGKVAQDTACEVSAESEGWSQVHCTPASGAVVDGWIKSSLLSPAPSSSTARSSTGAPATNAATGNDARPAMDVRLRFHTVPDGAEVFETGTFGETLVGLTPLVLPWSVDDDARRREFVVKKDGYVNARANVDPPPPTPTGNGAPVEIDITATLRAVPASTTPADAAR